MNRTAPVKYAQLIAPDQYDQWYRTPRGDWIGKTEYALLDNLTELRQGESLLDVGCGTGYFTQAFAAGKTAWIAGAERDEAMLRHAIRHRGDRQSWLIADAQRLPFPDRSFDVVISVAALCFVQDERRALVEMLRVARRRVALGLLNRHSLLYLEHGRHGGHGGYRGARWHSVAEARALFDGLPATSVTARSAVFIPSDHRLARWVEHASAHRRPDCGSFIAVAADKA
jgi:SAM-dependent methyltransferase